MKLFSRLFAKPPPPPPPSPAERVASLQAAPAEVVETTALGGDDLGLRVGATRLLPGGDALRVLAGLADPPPGVAASTPPAVRRAAHERLAQLIDDGSIDFDAVCGRPQELSESIAVAALCKDPDRLGQVLARIDDPAALAKLVTDGPSSRARQLAAAAIDDPAQLHDLLPRVRGKDKSAYRIIKQKCDALAAAERKVEEYGREVTELCASLERHSTRAHDLVYVATLEALTARWRALPARPDPLVEQRGEQALERCREVVAAHEREVAERTAARAAEREAEQQAREARERTLEAERQAVAERAEANAQALAEAAAAREAEEHARAEQRAAETQAQREIGSLIRLAGDALRRGNSRKAARFRMGVEEALQAAPAMPPHVARNLQQLDERLNELKQWKDYAVAPKRIELIEEMEALVGSEEEPEALAEHVRALQQEWRTINKGIASDAPVETERFQQAFQAAFKPCQEFFALQAAARRENLDARKQVLERLKAFETTQQGEQADFPLVAQVLREAPREWRSHSPVDRDASRPAEIEFQQTMDRLRAMLNAWYERNDAAKKSLITQARHLSTVEDTSQAIDGVKRLNVLWKETGPVPREQSQALWDEFRGLCDAVFQRREQAYTQYSAGLEAAKTQAVALCEQVEQAAGESAADRLPGHARVAEWHAAFEALGELPRADARNLRDRFQRAVSRYEEGLARQDARDAEAAESNLLEAGRHVRAYERAVMQDAPSAEREALKNAAESFMAGVRRWPKGGLQALKQALSRADSASDADHQAREQALRMLCIRLEILSSMATPPEDETLRRDYQMRLLMESLGQGTHADTQTWDAMLLEWIGIGAVAPEVHEDLQRRFVRCLAKRPAKSSSESPFRNHKGDDRPARDPDDRKARRDGRGRSDSAGRRQ
jgi:Domain of Unknown Function (DUF349)